MFFLRSITVMRAPSISPMSPCANVINAREHHRDNVAMSGTIFLMR
jgi:hypothetical protein